jgi:hypothetical protein
VLFCCRESLRCQELLDGEVRELYNSAALPIDDGDETRAYRHDRFLSIFWTPICVECRAWLVKLNCKNLCKFFDAKRANGHRETSEESLCIFSFLLVDSQQCTAICFIQCLWQVIQDPPNTCRKGATEPVNLADNPPKPTKSCERPL